MIKPGMLIKRRRGSRFVLYTGTPSISAKNYTFCGGTLLYLAEKKSPVRPWGPVFYFLCHGQVVWFWTYSEDEHWLEHNFEPVENQ